MTALRCVRAIAAALLLICTGSHAQTTSGTVVGMVKDQSGAVIPGAAVVVTNVGTNIAHSVLTSAEGNFTVVNLIPGEYRVSVQMTGFRKAITETLILLVNQTLRADVTLEPGAVETQVEVTASGTLIETDSSTIAKVVENKQIVDLPLSSRNFMNLTVLTPGTVTDNGGSVSSEQRSYRSALSGGAVWVGGGRGASNGYMIDGVENNDPGFQTPAITPPIDAIQEFKLMSKNYGAEFGGSASQINIAIKSGTNDLHGTVYEFLRNDALNARNFFAVRDPLSGRLKPQLRYNQFGASVGGPIWIPKVVDGRNRLFFFTNYEGTRVRSYSNGLGKFPTAAQQQGDFAGLAPIYDPLTNAPFPNNRIPDNRIDGKSKQLFSLFALPNVPAQPGFNTVKVLNSPENVSQIHTRIDARITDKDAVFGRVSFSNQDRLRPSVAPLAGLVDQQKGRNLALSYTRIFGPRFVNEARVGFNRPISLRAQEGAYGDDVAGKLFVGTDRAPVTFGAPSISLADYAGLGATGNGPLNYVTNSWSFVEALNLTTGKHTLKAGIDLRRFLFKEVNAYRPRGAISFSGLFTSGPLNATGDAMADFLLGMPFTAAVNQGNFTGWYHGQGYNLYAQDDWKLTSQFTLNFGLRYEYRTPLTEEGDRVSVFDPTYPGGRMLTPNKAIVEQLNNPLIGLAPDRFLVAPDRNNFAPRVGFAYRPFRNNRTVFRGGYGVFYDTFEFNEYIFPVLNPPWQKTSQVNATKANPIRLDSLFPTAPTPVPTAGTLSSLSLDRGNRTPYMQQWNFDIQRELGSNFALELGYLGSKGAKLATRSSIQQGQLLAPGAKPVFHYYNFGSILMDRTEGYSKYNALIARLEKRFGKGVYLLAHYTWSKSMDITSSASAIGTDGGIQDAWNLRAEYAPSSFDVTQRFVASGIWDLPFGRGKKLASGVGPALNKLIAGWQVNGIYQVQTGFPFSVRARDVSNTLSSSFPRPDVIGDVHAKDPQDPSRAFNRSAFAQPAAGTFGNAGRNILRGKALNNLDTSLIKNTSLGERLNLQFRAEFFNALNHTQLGPFPGTGYSLDPQSSFGVYRTTQVDARVAQLALKLIF